MRARLWVTTEPLPELLGVYDLTAGRPWALVAGGW